MTKKDYELIAGVFAEDIKFYSKDPNDEPDVELVESVARSMAEALQKDNPQFNRDKFLQACGIKIERKTWSFMPTDGIQD